VLISRGLASLASLRGVQEAYLLKVTRAAGLRANSWASIVHNVAKAVQQRVGGLQQEALAVHRSIRAGHTLRDLPHVEVERR
jgi:hypothetical protein